jgi:thiamine kinase-like enzyme
MASRQLDPPPLRLTFGAMVQPEVHATVSALLEEWGFPPRGGEIFIEVLSGGANNVNLALHRGDDAWALKLRNALGARFGVEFAASILCQKAAAECNLAPAILAHTLPAGHFISEFVKGETLRPAIIRERNLAAGVIETLHRMHAIEGAFREFSIFDDIRTFMRGADQVGGIRPTGFDDLLAIALRMEQALLRVHAPRSLCHNDLVPQNLMLAGGKVRLVDFDYAGIAWVATDLACMTSQAEMTAEETEALLALYDPALDDGQRARVEVLRFSNALREVAWAAFAEPVLAHQTALLCDWSYAGHARMNLELAKSILHRRSADALISAASRVRPSALF